MKIQITNISWFFLLIMSSNNKFSYVYALILVSVVSLFTHNCQYNCCRKKNNNLLFITG